MGAMTMRDRMLAVIRGDEIDRVPFAQYSNCGGPDEEIWSVIGRGNMGLLRGGTIFRITHPGCAFESADMERDGLRGAHTVLHTPEGDLEEEKFFEPAFGGVSIKRHYVRDPKDYRILNAYLRSWTVTEDLDAFRRSLKELGEDGLPFVWLGRTPFQQLWIEWVGLEDLCVHMVEVPEIVEETMRLLAANHLKVFEVVRGAVGKVEIPYVNFGDNITAPVIGETYFRRYCVPQYDRMAEMLEGTGIPVCVHMDGDLKPLWGAIGESKIGGLDSLTPPPDNDTSAGEAASMWPRMRLFLNFPSSVHLAQPKVIYRRAMDILMEAGHTGRLWIQISENVPRGVWRRSFPSIVQAIHDFGKPQPGLPSSNGPR